VVRSEDALPARRGGARFARGGTLIAAFVDSRQESPDLAGKRFRRRPRAAAVGCHDAGPTPTIDLDSLPVDRRKPHRKSP
jgi:hypothetical protein